MASRAGSRSGSRAGSRAKAGAAAKTKARTTAKPRAKPVAPSRKPALSTVDEYLEALDHPRDRGIRALRKAILGVSPRIREEVKWNAPSFRLVGHFATFRLHPVPMFQLVLHAGAKTRGRPRPFRLDDPDGLAKWAAPDRCAIAFRSDADALARRAYVARLVRQWMTQLPRDCVEEQA